MENKVEETKTTEGNTEKPQDASLENKEARTYQQSDVDNIVNKVKENLIKETETKLNEKETKITELEKQFNEYKIEVKKNDLKNMFVNEFGGNDGAFDNLLKARPELLNEQNPRVKINQLKGTEPYWFNNKTEGKKFYTLEEALKLRKDNQVKVETKQNK